jgi:hypothetical protein
LHSAIVALGCCDKMIIRKNRHQRRRLFLFINASSRSMVDGTLIQPFGVYLVYISWLVNLLTIYEYNSFL